LVSITPPISRNSAVTGAGVEFVAIAIDFTAM
jgi:hypothetical protein